KEKRVHQAADRSAGHKKEQISNVTKGILDRTAEDPEIDHVSKKVNEATVQEKGGDQSDGHFDTVVTEGRRIDEARRNEAEDADQHLGLPPQKQLSHEDDDVHHHQGAIHHR